jgi:hypothetical protein
VTLKARAVAPAPGRSTASDDERSGGLDARASAELIERVRTGATVGRRACPVPPRRCCRPRAGSGDFRASAPRTGEHPARWAVATATAQLVHTRVHRTKSRYCGTGRNLYVVDHYTVHLCSVLLSARRSGSVSKGHWYPALLLIGQAGPGGGEDSVGPMAGQFHQRTSPPSQGTTVPPGCMVAVTASRVLARQRTARSSTVTGASAPSRTSRHARTTAKPESVSAVPYQRAFPGRSDAST